MLFKDFDSEEISIEYTRTSKGDQPKWKDGEYWYKRDMMGYEALSEVMISALLDKSNLEDHLVYEPVMIRYNRRTMPGCFSREFKNPDEELFTLERIHLAYTGETVAEAFRRIQAVDKRIEYTVNFIVEHTGIADAGVVITKWIEADAFFLNEDRHTNNIAFLRSERSGAWRFCPYYDNGLTLLSDVNDYPMNERISELVPEVHAKPFSRTFDRQVQAARSLYGPQLSLGFDEEDVRKAIDPLREMYDERITERVENLIRVQSNKYKDLFG